MAARLLCALLLLCPCAGRRAGADEVVLVQGDVLIGEIVEQTDAVVVVRHAVLGILEVPMVQVADIHGDACDPADAYRSMPVAALPEATMGAKTVTAVQETAGNEQPSPAATAEPAATTESAVKATPDEPAPDAADAAQPDSAAESDSSPVTWSSFIEFGGSATSGNSDARSFTLIYKLEALARKTRFKLDAAYAYGEKDGNRSDNKFSSGLRNDWRRSKSPWFIFAEGRWDYDEFQSWENRLSANAGVANDVIDSLELDVTLRVGGGGKREFGSTVSDRVLPEGVLGLELEWRIDDRQKVELDSTLFPDFDQFGEYRARSTANWSFKISEQTGLSLNFGVFNEYQSIVDEGKSHADFRLFAGLRVDF